MLGDILDLVRGVHGLYNSGDPDYYHKMNQNPYSMMMGGFNPYNSYGSGGIGTFLSQLAPVVHGIRNYDKTSYSPMDANYGRPMKDVTPYSSGYGGWRNDFLRKSNSYSPRPRYSFDNPSPAVRSEQQRELEYWNKQRDEHLLPGQQYTNVIPSNNPYADVRDTGMMPARGNLPNNSTPRGNYSPSNYGDDYFEFSNFARGGPAKKYYVRERMPGYDIGRTIPHLLANYWNPRLDPSGLAGNAVGAEAARAGANYGINRLMGTDGYRWSDPRELTRGERFKRFFTHSIPRTINKTFGTNLSTDHNRYWNAAKGLPPAINNRPGILSQGIGSLGDRAVNMGHKVHEGISAAVPKISNSLANAGNNVYNAIPEIKAPINNTVNRAAMSISPFAASNGGGWQNDPNIEQPLLQPSYLSRAYNALPSMPNLGIMDHLKGYRNDRSSGQHFDNIQKGMKLWHPEHPKLQPSRSESDKFVDAMLEAGANINDDDEFFDARDEYDPDFHAPKRLLAGGGYTGHLAPDEFVHRRHHKIEEPNNLDQMIRAYIAHMMQQQMEENEEE